jgi:hypothetical protein
VGHSIRRILLSSLEGAAVTSVRIEGALHEFSTLPDVVEDVTDIVLNLKEVLVRMSDPRPRTIRLDKDGEGTVTAGDIRVVDGVDVLNPEQPIATLSKGGKLHLEMSVAMGRGYVPAEALAPEVQAKQLAAVREEIPKVPFSISPMNQMALDAMAAMAAEHKFTIYLVNGPLNETIVTPATKPYFDALDRALTDFAEAHPHVEHIPGYATYPSSETRDEGHLLATAARKYTAWVAESIQRP